MRRVLPLILIAASVSAQAERINHAGRILQTTPTITTPVQFNTAYSDSILGTLQVFPRDNPWNEDISRRPRLSNSDAMIAKIKSELLSTRQKLRPFFEMNFCMVPNNQPLVAVDFVEYPHESDPSPYPIPALQPIETWPRETGTQTLDDWQRDVLG
ncbi:MAG: hypothetical protein ABL962_21960, partial [Fimbriimonadaceae bacterium]